MFALAPFAQAQVVRLRDKSDTPPIEVILIPPAKQSDGVGASTVVTLAVFARVNLDSSVVTIGVAGPAISPSLADEKKEWRNVNRSKSLLPEISVRQESQRNFGTLQAGQKRELPIDLRITGPGVGYIAAAVRSPADGLALVNEAATLYYLVADGTVYWSMHSVMNLREQQLRSELKKQRVPGEEIEKRIERLRRSGAAVKKKRAQPKKNGAITSDPDSYNSVTVEGSVLFTDINGGTHPVRFATLQIWDEEAGADELVDTTTTDAAGHYSSTVDDNDGDGTGRDFFVIALAQGATVSVEDLANPGTVWTIDSLPAEDNVADGSTLTIDFTATNDLGNPNNVAFEVYEAVNALSRYLGDLGEPLPALVHMLYPRNNDGSFYDPGTQSVTTGGTDVHDWDNLHHEYGHHIQHLYNTENSPGGAHNLGQNLCATRGKDAGLRLSWGEAWPTFFGTMAQRALWDFYDPANDDGDTVALSAQELWDTVKNDQSHTFSEFWRALILSRAEAQKAAFGAVLQDHGIGSAPTAPVTGTTYSGGATPNFQWTGNMQCDAGGNARYSLRTYNSDFTSLAWASPWQSPASLAPSNAQRDLIFVGLAAPLRWVVASRDITAPETGAYYGGSFVINDDFAVPDRSPVDLILALDVSDSMNSPVPGSTTGLTKIALLRQAAEVFLQTWRLHRVDGDRVGIGIVYLSSDTSSIPAAPPVLRDLATDVDAVITDIRARAASGCTAIGGALQVSFNSFDAGSMNKRVIILFTDGMQSINPFVGEDGIPARLKIQTFPSAGTLPFGAFFCSNDTANDLSGADIVPDGQFLDDHAVQIHTIGVGVDGADFTGLVQRIADETSALNHFTSSPDEELDILYTNDLVNSLKTASLEVVGTWSGPLSSGAGKTLLVPVNETATSLTLVLSWKGASQGNVSMSVDSPGGSAVAPTEVRQGVFYRIAKFNLPAKVKGTPIPSAGNWTVRLTGPSGTAHYQLSAIVDEPCFHYQFQTPHRAIAAGERLLLSVALSQSGKPLRNADGIFVEVVRPAQNTGNLLAEWLPRMKGQSGPAGYREEEKMPQFHPTKREFYAAVNAAYNDPAFVKRARARTSERVFVFDDGLKEHGDATADDGIYSGFLAATQIPGSYALKLFLQASSRCGRVTRTESMATLVEVASPDPKRSVFFAVPATTDSYTVIVAPADRFGNLVGPGKPESVEVYVRGGRLMGDLRDQLDGSYEQGIVVERDPNPSITVLVNGKQLATVPLRELLRNYKSRL